MKYERLNQEQSINAVGNLFLVCSRNFRNGGDCFSPTQIANLFSEEERKQTALAIESSDWRVDENGDLFCPSCAAALEIL